MSDKKGSVEKTGKKHGKKDRVGNIFTLANFKDSKQTFVATENTIVEMVKNKNIAELSHGNFDFLINANYKSAVLLSFTVVESQSKFLKAWNRKYKNPYDVAKRITSVNVVHKQIVWFLNNTNYKDHTIVVSTGSHLHKSCIFVRNITRNNETCFEAIYFNANFSQKTQGVQFSRTANGLLRKLGKKLVNIQSYYSPCHNRKGRCSYHTWKSIYNHLINGFSPFENVKVNLKDYKHYMTEYSYQKYHKNPHAKKEELKYKNWMEFDTKLANIGPVDLMNIFKKINNVISEEFSNF